MCQTIEQKLCELLKYGTVQLYIYAGEDEDVKTRRVVRTYGLLSAMGIEVEEVYAVHNGDRIVFGKKNEDAVLSEAKQMGKKSSE